MKSGRIHLRVSTSVKAAATRIAKKRGITLSAMIEGYLREVVEMERVKNQVPVDAEQALWSTPR